jgi:hypothetical protein
MWRLPCSDKDSPIVEKDEELRMRDSDKDPPVEEKIEELG